VVISETLALGTTNTTAFPGDRGLAVEGAVNTANQVDTGIVKWNSTTGKLESSNTLVQTSGGDIGIGTSSPNARLHVQATNIGLAPLLRLGNLSTANNTTKQSGILFELTDTIGSVKETSRIVSFTENAGNAIDAGMLFATRASDTINERMRILGNGNVGINTTTPSRRLEVISTFGTEAVKLLRQGNYGSVIRLGRNGVTETATISYPADGVISFDTVDTERMRISATGNVGIGTASPATTLVVATSSNTNGLQIRRNSFDNNDYALLGFRISTAELADNLAEIRGLRTNRVNSGDTDLVFTTSIGGATPTEKLRIRDNGNVGIGTTSPATILDIKGELSIRSAESAKRMFLSFNEGLDASTIGSIQDGVAYKNTHINRDGGNVFIGANSAGNVGIGTASPDVFSRFHGKILGISTSSGNSFIGINGASGSNGGVEMGAGGTRTGIISSNATTMELGSVTNIPLSMVTNGSTRMTITGAGNVGIGTTSPADVLHVVNNTNNAGIRLERTTATTGSYTFAIKPTGAFEIGETGVSTRFLITKTDGLVGINETSPTAQLQVKSGATTRVPLIVDTLASQTADLAQYKINGTNISRIDSSGYFVGIGLYNITGANNALIITDTTGTSIRRNVADTNPALIVNLANASATGNIQVWQKAGTALSQISNAGIFVGQSRPTRTDITANATLALADEGKVLRVNSSSNLTVTIPLNSSVAFPIDTEIAILRYGTGTVSISPTAGVTLESKAGERKISGQFGSVALKKIGTDEWVLVGSLEA
jgi:hypothetical protein